MQTVIDAFADFFIFVTLSGLYPVTRTTGGPQDNVETGIVTKQIDFWQPYTMMWLITYLIGNYQSYIKNRQRYRMKIKQYCHCLLFWLVLCNCVCHLTTLSSISLCMCVCVCVFYTFYVCMYIYHFVFLSSLFLFRSSVKVAFLVIRSSQMKILF